MKILVDVDMLEEDGILTPAMAATLRRHAVQDTGSTAINFLLAFGAIVLAAGAGAMVPTASVALVIGLLFIGSGWFVQRNYREQWDKLASIWMVVGGLITAGALAMLVGTTQQGDVVIERPFLGCLTATIVLVVVALLAQSRLLIALVPLALLGAIGGSTGYWHASYEICVREPLLTIVLFSGLGLLGWSLAKQRRGARQAMALTFTRMCVILVNMGFWIGSLWGDTPGQIWTRKDSRVWDYNYAPAISDMAFTIAWAVALLAAGAWGAKTGRRFLVNTVAVFGAIHFYTQWFERLGAEPFSVMIAGAATIAFGLALWKYNKRQVAA